jgi:hypothetical protein
MISVFFANLQERYAVTIKNKFQMIDHEPTTQMYECFITAVEETAAETLETVPKGKKGQHLLGNNRIAEARKDVRKMYSNVLKICNFSMENE